MERFFTLFRTLHRDGDCPPVVKIVYKKRKMEAMVPFCDKYEDLDLLIQFLVLLRTTNQVDIFLDHAWRLEFSDLQKLRKIAVKCWKNETTCTNSISLEALSCHVSDALARCIEDKGQVETWSKDFTHFNCYNYPIGSNMTISVVPICSQRSQVKSFKSTKRFIGSFYRMEDNDANDDQIDGKDESKVVTSTTTLSKLIEPMCEENINSKILTMPMEILIEICKNVEFFFKLTRQYYEWLAKLARDSFWHKTAVLLLYEWPKLSCPSKSRKFLNVIEKNTLLRQRVRRLSLDFAPLKSAESKEECKLLDMLDLRSATLQSLLSSNFFSIMNSLRRSFMSLTCLDISVVGLSISVLYPCFDFFPNLESLSLRGFETGDDDDEPCPATWNLKSLDLRHSSLSARALKAVVQDSGNTLCYLKLRGFPNIETLEPLIPHLTALQIDIHGDCGIPDTRQDQSFVQDYSRFLELKEMVVQYYHPEYGRRDFRKTDDIKTFTLGTRRFTLRNNVKLITRYTVLPMEKNGKTFDTADEADVFEYVYDDEPTECGKNQ